MGKRDASISLSVAADVLVGKARYCVECDNALGFLSRLFDGSVKCCVTSPPYWGQRAYDVEGQVGLEPAPSVYVAHLVRVLHEVKRVLDPTGTLWLNLGDAFAGGGYSNHRINGPAWQAKLASDKRRSRQQSLKSACISEGIQAKELIGLPWMVALALRQDGWRIRSEIIWAKGTSGEHRAGACMPESVKDRPTRSHEHLFLLTKQGSYYYDSAAVAERSIMKPQRRLSAGMERAVPVSGMPVHRGIGRASPARDTVGRDSETGNLRSVWRFGPAKSKASCSAVMPEGLARLCVLAGCPRDAVVLDPFAGSGTTGAVAVREGRRFLGCDLHPTHAAEARDRIAAACAPIESQDRKT